LILSQLALVIGSRSEKQSAALPRTSGKTSKQTHASFRFMAELAGDIVASDFAIGLLLW